MFSVYVTLYIIIVATPFYSIRVGSNLIGLMIYKNSNHRCFVYTATVLGSLCSLFITFLFHIRALVS